jgi:class 3 adenylate cyclase
MPPALAGDAGDPAETPLLVKLLGPFSMSVGEQTAGPWARPPARRLCELVLVSRGRRVTRDFACEALFPELSPTPASEALYKALSQARSALAGLGPRGRGVLQANRTYIWAELGSAYAVDLDLHQERLRLALQTEPGMERDYLLQTALADEGILLEDEPYASWAIPLRERLEMDRQEARLALARDRAKGKGRSTPEEVVSAWEACFVVDPTCEEAASALMRLYRSQTRAALVESTYKRCRDALEDLGLKISPALEEVYLSSHPAAHFYERPAEPQAPRYTEERRLVSVVFTELSNSTSGGHKLSPEDLREMVGGVLAEVVAQVEEFGGTVTSVSGAGLVAVFGAPESHEDDPERALRATFRAVTGAGAGASGLLLRAGVETGPAIVGPIGGHVAAHYGAVGEVVGIAAALQSVAQPSSVLVGPATRAATEGLFGWGPSEEVALSPGAKPLKAHYLDHPKARPAGQSGRRRLAGSAPVFGRDDEMSVLRTVLRDLTSGQGSVMVVAGEAGLGKTRIVSECRKLFMTWVGAGSGRLPLWLEARAASYASTQPYGLYRQLLSAWVGAAPEDGEEVVRTALERALKAVFGRDVDDEQLVHLAEIMGIRLGEAAAGLSRYSPEQLQKARFATLTALLSRLVSYGPTLVVLEDLHWADPTSMRLTEEFSRFTVHGPLLLVLTRRPEPDPGLSSLETAIAAVPDLRLQKIDLAPLSAQAERQLVTALLGAGTQPEILDIVSHGTEGNPLFLEERFASLLETGALVKAPGGNWEVEVAAGDELPEAIERLMRSRVDRLPVRARDAIVAASALGPEFSLDALKTVTELNGGLLPAVSELCATGMLVELRKIPEPAYRFRHGLIQEATYKGLLRGQRRALHSRAAWGLEQASAERLEEMAGLLGYHYALAGEVDRATHYLEIAGDRAAATFANDEARTSYSWALDLLGDEPVNAVASAGLWVKLGRLAWRLGHFDDSRSAFEQAANLASARHALVSARALCFLGAVETAGHHHDAALSAFVAAEEALDASPDKETDQWAEIWIDIQMERSTLHYWRNEPEAQALVIETARPVVESRAKGRQKVAFYSAVSLQRARATRYFFDDSVMEDYRAAWAAVVEAGLENEQFHVRFSLSFALLWHGDLAAAQAELEQCLEICRRADDKTLELRCLIYLCCAHLRQHHVDTVGQLARQGEDLAQSLAFPEYEGMANAMLAWAAWKKGRFVDAEVLAEKALDLWHSSVVHYSWCWAGLWPLIAVRLAAGRTAPAVAAARELLGPDQQRFPAELETAVQVALDAWDKGDGAAAGTLLLAAVGMASELRYA